MSLAQKISALLLAHGLASHARQEDMKNVVSQEGHEQKPFDSAWICLKM